MSICCAYAKVFIYEYTLLTDFNNSHATLPLIVEFLLRLSTQILLKRWLKIKFNSNWKTILVPILAFVLYDFSEFFFLHPSSLSFPNPPLMRVLKNKHHIIIIFDNKTHKVKEFSIVLAKADKWVTHWSKVLYDFPLFLIS